MDTDCFDHYFALAAEKEAGQERRLSLPVNNYTAGLYASPRHTANLTEISNRRRSTPCTNFLLRRDFVNHCNPVLEEDESQTSAEETTGKCERKKRSPRRTPGKKRRSRSNSAPATDSPVHRRRITALVTPGCEHKPRACSAPSEDSLLTKFRQLNCSPRRESYVARNFVTSRKGLVNKGDSLQNKLAEKAAEKIAETDVTDEGIGRSRECSVVSDTSDSGVVVANSQLAFNVLMIGSHGVGKSAIALQFQTSEYMGHVDHTGADHAMDVTIPIMLDGEETVLNVTEVHDNEDLFCYENVDAIILVYSVADKSSFNYVTEILREIQRESPRPIILVGNKQDLVRLRKVSKEEARMVALAYRCKFTEVSTVLNHGVDDLLVGLVKHIHSGRSTQPEDKTRLATQRNSLTRLSRWLPKAGRQMLEKFVTKKDISKSAESLVDS